MDLVDRGLEAVGSFIPLLLTIAFAVLALSGLNWAMGRRWQNKPNSRFQHQLIMLCAMFVAGLAVIVALPVSDTLRGQLLSLIGILLSAAIALSSTTFIGNIMAGIMLRSIRSSRPGDFITVGELTGRITEMGLLHTEIQTEFRDLVTVPNLHMVTNPVKVVRRSGTIITTEVSLGYDVPNSRVAELLCDAAAKAGLRDAFVQVRELGDFSVTYRVAGLLEDVQSLISARSALRVAALNSLHLDGIEIVSPNFVNQRRQDAGRPVIPTSSRLSTGVTATQAQAEEIAFDKAEVAASVEELRAGIEKLDKELAEGDKSMPDAEKKRLEDRRAWLLERLRAAEEKQASEDAS